MDYQATLYDPIYLIQGVPVTLTLADGTVIENLTALDKTTGVDVGDGVNVQTIIPAATLRVAELRERSVSLDALPDATLAMNDFIWRVASTRARPSLKGENDGEVWLLLEDKRVATEPDSETE